MSEQQDNGAPRAVAGAAGLGLVALVAAWLVAGCGQKGPLYLPEDEQPAAQAAGATAPGTPPEEPSEEADSAAGTDG